MYSRHATDDAEESAPDTRSLSPTDLMEVDQVRSAFTASELDGEDRVEEEASVEVRMSKDRVFQKLYENISSLHCYALDVLCLPKSSVKEIITQTESIISEFSKDLTQFLQDNADDFPRSLSSFEKFPYMIIDKVYFDNYLALKCGFQDSEQVTCSNGDCFSYVPIGYYLKSHFVKDKEMFDCNEAYFQSEYFKTHVEPYTDPNDTVMHIILYADEFEVCNPIGVARKKHKMFAVYFKVLNFHPKHSSSLNSIHLVLLVKSSTLKDVGLKEVFSPLIEEMKDLYFLGVQDEKKRLLAMANFFCGDNLASNYVGGFSCGFSRGHFCRFCMIKASDVQSTLTEATLITRNHENVVEGSFECSSGMRLPSPFLDLPYVKMPIFFPPDIMHDVFEGVSHLVLCTVLLELLKKRLISLDVINRIIQSFSPFSVATITTSHLHEFHLPFTAAQMSYWIQFLPSQFGCFFAEDEEVWLLLLKHCEIVEILLYPNLCSETTSEYLKSLIIEQNLFLCSFFPNNIKYKCKLHFMTHYPEIIKKYGGLSPFSTMRFEALHQYFKQLTRKLRQFKNLPLTLSYRYQRRFALIRHGRLNREVKSALTSKFDFYELDCRQRNAVCAYVGVDLTDSDLREMILSKHITHGGFDYYCKDRQTALVLEGDQYRNAMDVGLVTHIFFVSEKWILLMQKANSSYEPHFKSFIIHTRSSEYFCQSLATSLHPPVDCFILGGYLAFTMKHIVKT